MSTNQPIVRPEDLLDHQGFLRGLVRSLVFDHEEAEDYLQETWAYAFRKPPRAGPGLKAWLATVARNCIRQDRRSRGRRDLREAAVAAPETDAGTEGAVERERQRRRVVDAVLDLHEPYRTVVVLRYLDDLPPREIARRTGAPVETVRTRIKRALAMLRKRFDAEHRGDRRAWCMALVPLLANERKAAAATGVAGLLGAILLMGGKPKIAITVSIVALLVGAAFVFTPSDRTAGTTPDRPAEPVPPIVAGAESPPAEPDAPIVSPTPPAEATPPPAARVGIAFRDGDGRVLSVEEVVRRYREADIPLAVRIVPESLFTGTDVADMLRMRVEPADEWAMPIPLAVGPKAIGLGTLPDPGRYRLFLGRPGAAPLVTRSFDIRAEGDVKVDVHLPLTVETVRVRLVDEETRSPLAGATVTPLYEYGDDHMFIPGPPRIADPGGLVLIPLLGAEDRGRNRQPSWWVKTETHLGLISNWGLSKNEPGLEMEMPVPRAVAVTGKAWLSNGKSAAGKKIVWMGKGLSTVATVADDGTFRIFPVAIWDDRGAEIILVEDLASFKVKQARAKLTPGETAEVTIGEPAGSKTYAVVAGRVTIGGRPLPGAFVVTRTVGQNGNKGFVLSGADGTYRKEDVQPGSVDVAVWFGDPRTVDDFRAERAGRIDMAPGEVHTFDFDLPAGAFRVTVVDDETGKPIPGALATARPADPEAGRDRFPGFRYTPGWGLRVGEDGAAVLLAMLPGEEHVVVAAADGYGKATSKGHVPGTQDRPGEVTVRLKKK
jgi:RNA polymerase sigma-70 factor (ECF subfamily)